MGLTIASLTGKQPQDIEQILNNQIIDLALSRYEWTYFNRDQSDFIEMSLLKGQMLGFVNHSELGYIICEVIPSTGLNYMGKPTGYTIHGVGLDPQTFSRDEIAILKPTPTCNSMMDNIAYYARRLTSCVLGSDSNIQTQRWSTLLVTDELSEMSITRAYENVASGSPVIIAKQGFDIDSFKSLSTATPYCADKIISDYNRIWSECMTMLGINNCNTDKKERLVTDEVNSNNQQIETFRNVGKRERDLFIKEVKDVFNIDIECNFIGGENIGEIYDNIAITD